MQVLVSGKKIDIGGSLQEHVKDRLEKGVKKYFNRALHADVTFSKQSHLFSAVILVNEGTGTGVTIKADAQSDDPYSAFDGALLRIEKQLRRYKRRITNHHKPKIAGAKGEEYGVLKGVKYVINPVASGYDADSENAGDEGDQPVIVAENATSIESLSVAEAVMKMDLAHLPALLFINQANGRINVVYHRADGNISWVDSGAM